MLIQITEYLGIDIATERWMCHRCGHDLGSARECYKIGCLCRARDPREIHFPLGPDTEFNFSFDPKWMQVIEYYCPGCATLVETEYLPPGHPLTWDIQIDLDALRRKYLGKREDARLQPEQGAEPAAGTKAAKEPTS